MISITTSFYSIIALGVVFVSGGNPGIVMAAVTMGLFVCVVDGVAMTSPT